MDSAGLAFSKATATGNDFILIDARTPDFAHTMTAIFGTNGTGQIVKRLCDRHFGIGADGVVFLHSSTQLDADLKWDFYNNDGSSAEMCGNAARGFALFARSRGVMKEPLRFATAAGLVEVSTIDPKKIEVTMPPPKMIARDRLFENGLRGDVINSGVPHVVLDVPSLDERGAQREVAQKLRREPTLGSAGANITFRQKLSATRLRSLTFERGVEDFTLSCGTGAVAAAISHHLRWPQTDWLEVDVPGGILEVKLSPTGRQDQEVNARLRGPAQILFTGTLREGWNL